MARLRYNGLATGASGSTVTLALGASLASSGTTITFNAALTYNNGTAVPTITGSDYIVLLILDANGHISEIVYLTAYTAGATTGTISRGKEGTTGVAHSSGDKISHGPTAADVAGIIAKTAYLPAALATYTTTSTTLVDVDATNLAVTFVAPPSGDVLVRLTALSAATGTAPVMNWALRNGSTTMGNPAQALNSPGTTIPVVSVPILVTGLTPGSSYTFKWAYMRVGGTNCSMYVGGTSADFAPAATMEVHALP